MSKATCLYSRLFLFFALFQFFLNFLNNIDAKSPKTHHTSETPKLTVVLILDQGAEHHIKKLNSYLRYGLKDLLSNGVVYSEAYHPHGVPETTPGHHAFSTGTVPKDHGAVTNQWVINGQCKKTAYDLDTSKKAAVFGHLDCPEDGRSCHNTMVDGLSDQVIWRSIASTPNKVYALSLKSYPAIAMANRRGKAIWFDENTGVFTSSKKYFSQLPDWVDQFNKSVTLHELKKRRWHLAYNENHKAYDFPYIKNYDYAGLPFSLIDKSLTPESDLELEITKSKESEFEHKSSSAYELFLKSPFASEALFGLARQCVEINFDKKQGNSMVLWLSLSNFDLVGHMYGPDCLEVVDMLYHIDKQIQDFMNFLNRFVGDDKYVLVFSADHGIAPIPEIQQLRGFPRACRIVATELIKELNTHLFERFGVKDFVLCFEPSSFTIDEKTYKALNEHDQKALMNALIAFLKKYPGIKNAWTCEELQQACFRPDDLENFYKNQLFDGRFGPVICQPETYCLITNYTTGTSHATPYDYDTHVPLIIYYKNHLRPHEVSQRVWIPQVCATLAKLLNIPKASVSPFDPLPGLWE